MSRLGALNNYDKLVEIMQKYKLTRLNLKKILNSLKSTTEQKYDAAMALNILPKGSSNVRLRNRCFITGRPRGYYRLFGLSRIMLRQMANNGLLPGVVKSSW